MQAACLWRRALVAALEFNRIIPPPFARRLGTCTYMYIVHVTSMCVNMHNYDKGGNTGSYINYVHVGKYILVYTPLNNLWWGHYTYLHVHVHVPTFTCTYIHMSCVLYMENLICI